MMPKGAVVPAEVAAVMMRKMTMAIMMNRPGLGGRLHPHTSHSGDQSSDNFQFHYDVFPSRFERIGNLFSFVFTM